MADIQLNHETVDQAVAEMQQATAQMTSNLEHLVQALSQVSTTFTGEAANAWTDFQNAANRADSAMQADFGKGASVLSEMHSTLRTADRNGAAVFGH